MPTIAQFLDEARSWINTPFHHNAKIKGVGVDCVNHVVAVFEALGMMPADFSMPNYDTVHDGTELISLCDKYLIRISQEQLKPADLVAVAMDEVPQHLGIVGNYRHGGLSIIHASNARSCRPARVIETRLMFSIHFKFVAGFRVKELVSE